MPTSGNDQCTLKTEPSFSSQVFSFHIFCLPEHSCVLGWKACDLEVHEDVRWPSPWSPSLRGTAVTSDSVGSSPSLPAVQTACPALFHLRPLCKELGQCLHFRVGTFFLGSEGKLEHLCRVQKTLPTFSSAVC